MARLPLEGFRVVGLTVVWAGPFASALLSDLGAEVIRVESIQRWDKIVRMDNGEAARMRQAGLVPEDAPAWELNSNFNTVCRNRKSVTMDLGRTEGRELFYKLIAESDIFIENNTPDVVHHLGIDYETLVKHNPQLIMLSLSAFGNSGLYRNYRAYGSNMEALVGHAMLRGYPDMDSSNNSAVFFADGCAGATAAFAAMAALRHRIKTGKGQYIDMSQSENVTQTLSQAFMDYSMNRRVQTKIGNRDRARAPQGVYRCEGDDSWLAVSCGNDAEFEALCSVVGREELATDPRFATSLARYENQPELDEAITAWSEKQDAKAAFHTLQAAGVTAAPVMTLKDVHEDPHLAERGFWQPVEHPWAGTHDYMRPPMAHMSKTPLQFWRHAPTLGQDNEYVYKEVLGFSDEEYQGLIDRQHVGTTFLNV